MNYNEHYKLLKELNEKVKGLNRYGKILNIFIYGNSCMTLLHDKDFDSDHIDASVEWNSIDKDDEVLNIINEISKEQNIDENWMNINNLDLGLVEPSMGFIRILDEFEYLNIYCLDKSSFLAHKLRLGRIYDENEVNIIKTLIKDVDLDYNDYIRGLLERYYDHKILPEDLESGINKICNKLNEPTNAMFKW